jgi:deoxyribodipyrimidine photo-lyase
VRGVPETARAEGVVNGRRVRTLKAGPERPGPVFYWMSRDQRTRDNWALLHAQGLAVRRGAPLGVVFCLVPRFLNASIRQYGFMLGGLREVEGDLSGKGIPFFLLAGYPEGEVPAFLRKQKAGALVTDFCPIREKVRWKEKVAREIEIPFYEVDAHNIVPCWIASNKQEYAARTFRPKVRKALGEFLENFPPLKRHLIPWKGKVVKADWESALRCLEVDRAVPEIGWLRPGEGRARRALGDFLKNRLPSYGTMRNDPSRHGQSGLSPYLHFGQLSPQRVALEVMEAGFPPTGPYGAYRSSREAFLEELIVRRELSDNFCFHNPGYDRFEGLPAWARKTLGEHRRDRREHIYGREEFEGANTHDELWNAAQLEMAKRGKMHGYMRMYWAKKMLEWSGSPEEALETAIYLNDRYELDGRDPNGYAGIAWSMGGVHDRAWKERPVFGKVRYMSERGLRAKFNTDAYVRHAGSLGG